MNAYGTIEIRPELRLCKNGNRYGYFHTWEFNSTPVAASPFVGGAPAGVLSRVVAIVEFSDGLVKRIDPENLEFCDETNRLLAEIEKREAEKNEQA